MSSWRHWVWGVVLYPPGTSPSLFTLPTGMPEFKLQESGWSEEENAAADTNKIPGVIHCCLQSPFI